jgi:hypothetical protein
MGETDHPERLDAKLQALVSSAPALSGVMCNIAAFLGNRRAASGRHHLKKPGFTKLDQRHRRPSGQEAKGGVPTSRHAAAGRHSHDLGPAFAGGNARERSGKLTSRSAINPTTAPTKRRSRCVNVMWTSKSVFVRTATQFCTAKNHARPRQAPRK